MCRETPEEVAVDPVVLDAGVTAAEQQDAGADRHRAAVPSSRTGNGGLPWWKLKLFQKISLSVITLCSGGGNFSPSRAFGTMPVPLL